MTGCEVHESNLAAPFAARGAELRVEMIRLSTALQITSGGEEMVALIEGAATLVCDGEVHELTAGQGVLIPEGALRQWDVADTALLYRVSLA